MVDVGKVRPRTRANCEITMSQGSVLRSPIRSYYDVECITVSGGVRWREYVPNLVVNQGLDHVLNVITLSGNVLNWYVGIGVTAFGVAAGDTATSPGFTYSQAYSEATLPSFSAGAISAQSVDNSAAKAAFSINAATTLGGAFLVNSNVKTGASEGAILFGAASFAAPRTVANGDTVNVTITITTEVT